MLEIGKRSNIIKNPTSGRERNGSYVKEGKEEKKQVGETESTLDERKKAPHTKERKIFFLKSDPGWTQNKKSHSSNAIDGYQRNRVAEALLTFVEL